MSNSNIDSIEKVDEVNIKRRDEEYENVAISKTKEFIETIAKSGSQTSAVISSEMEDKDRHPVITGKRKNMNLSMAPGVKSAADEQPQVNEARAVHNMPVNRKDEVNKKPYESIIYGKSALGCNPIRAFLSKSKESKHSKASIPDTWGEERTERSSIAGHKETLPESSSRDHPYTPVKKKNHVKPSSKKMKNESATVKSHASITSQRSSLETSVHPIEEFEKLNMKLGKNKVHQDHGTITTSGGSGKILVHDGGEHRARTVSFSEETSGSRGKVTSADGAPSSVNEPSVSMHHSRSEPNEISIVRISDEHAAQPVITPSIKMEVESKAGSSKSPDLVAMETDKPTAAIAVTGLTKESKISDVGSSDSDDSNQVDPSIFKIEDFSRRYSGDASPRDSRAKSVTCTQLEELEEKLRNLSGRIAPLEEEKKITDQEDAARASSTPELISLGVGQNVDEPLPDSDEIVAGELNAAFASSDPELISSEAAGQNVDEQYPESDDSSCCRGRSFDEFPEISSNNNSNAAVSISSSTVSFDDSALPSYLPTFPTPVPEEITSPLNGTCSQINMQPSDVASTSKADDYVEEMHTTSVASPVSDDPVADNSGNRSGVSFPLNSSKDSAECVRMPCDMIQRSLRTLNTLFLHFVIPKSSIRLYISNSKQPHKTHVALGDMMRVVTEQILGRFGLNLLIVIGNPFRKTVTIETNNNEAASWKGYERVFNAHNYAHMNPLIDRLMENLIDPMIRMVEYNPSNMFSRLNNSCEFIFPNPAYSAHDHRIRLIKFFEQVIPLTEAIWNEAVQLLVSSYKELTNSTWHVSRTRDHAQSAVFMVPEWSDIVGVNTDESPFALPLFKDKIAEPHEFEVDRVLAVVTLDVLGIILAPTLTQLLLHPMNASENNIVDHEGWRKLRNYDFGTSMIHRAVNPNLVLLLAQELNEFQLYVAIDNRTLARHTRGENACNLTYRNHLIDQIITRNIIRPASDCQTLVITNATERSPTFIEI